MINAKERFNYTYIITDNEIEQDILLAYCTGKSFLWNIYLGWRKTNIKTNQMYFWIPTNKIEELTSLIDRIKREIRRKENV